MNDTQLLERLSAAYGTVETPAPSAALAELMDAGGIADDHERDDDRRVAVVVPFAGPRSRLRMRYLVAALVASFVSVSGLAVAGALPDSLQRQVSSVVSHLGIDLPSPVPATGDNPSHTPSDANGSEHRVPPSTSTGTPAAGADDRAGVPVAGSTAPRNAPTTTPTPTVPSLGDIGAVGGGTTPTTVPASGGLGLPPISLPPISLPPLFPILGP